MPLGATLFRLAPSFVREQGRCPQSSPTTPSVWSPPRRCTSTNRSS
ncbi:LOW QUALITY PROTEIN: homoserine O-acetyltransferase [Pseudomonas aeruginosa 39016]|nr:LOW QUALITY PROTEIN: homoserine O-acetyltransferase [Pseudomonas aeruginosa 39016]